MLKFEVIFTFEYSDQIVALFEFESSPSEAEFLYRTLDFIREPERSELRKVSVRQLVDDYSVVLPWIIESDGKYLWQILFQCRC